MTIIVLIAVLLLSITFHEFMHAYVSDQLGDDTARLSGRISLNPLAHIDVFTTILLPILLFLAGLPVIGAAKPVPFNPNRLRNGESGMAMVAAAGPIANFVIASISAILLRLLLSTGFLRDVLELVVMVNVGFFVFNLIPFPPLDGSRILYVLAPESVREVMRQIERYGLVSVFIFIFLLFYTPLSNVLVGILRFVILFLVPDFQLISF